jgi:hypothetical protein
VNDWALGWLRAMTASSSVQPPASVRTPRIETPAPLRHTIPLVEGVAPARLPKNESLADLQRYAWQCVGLCIGGTCLTCDAIAVQIGEARLVPTGQRDAREADLTQQITALREGRC